MQLIISTIFIAVLLILVSFISFPEAIKQVGNDLSLTYLDPYICSVIGLVSGLLIAAFT
jgi:Na+/H+-translocating membrane pyrophosphatase